MSAVPCELCQAEAGYNFHHFIPRTLHSNKWFKKRFTREEMRQGLLVCKKCHTMVHTTFTEKELGRSYHSREALLAHPTIARYVEWKQRTARSQPPD